MTTQPQAQALQRAAIAIKGLRQQLEKIQHEPLAIIGMACRFPGGIIDPAGYWNLLINNTNAITPIPPDRWDSQQLYHPNPNTPGKMATRWGGFLDNISHFDADFFNISPREATHLDPQQRLLLETSWQALEHAGQAPHKLSHTPTGTFIAISSNDYLRQMAHALHADEINAYFGSGNTLSVAAGRIAHILGLNGPALAIDTACSSSLVALHLACQSLRTRQTNLALVGGVNLILDPGPTIAFSKARMMAADGHCKTFSATADGYVRSEGCAVVIVKRLSDAQQDNDNILALIHGIATNHDGRSSGLTVPNKQAQQQVIQDALANAPHLSPHDISYVEAHGTGTPLGDPIELQALAHAYTAQRHTPLLVGSVKTNLGHLETTAGMASLLKVILSLQHGTLPAHLHAQTLTPHIDWQASQLQVVQNNTPWPEPRYAGVSSFGFSGTNAHAIIGGYTPPTPEPSHEPTWHILPLSAKTQPALQELAQQFQAYLATSTASLSAIAHTLQSGRVHHHHRLTLICQTHTTAQNQLTTYLNTGQLPPPTHHTQIAQQYQQGQAPTWPTSPTPPPRPTPLPTYPFQRQPYWFTPSQKPNPNHITSHPTDHPLLGQRLHSPLPTAQFTQTWASQAHPLLTHHSLFGKPIVPVPLFIELALSAAHHIWGIGSYQIETLQLDAPLQHTADLPIHTTFSPTGHCQIFSATTPWTRHMSATVQSAPSQPPPPISLPALQATYTNAIDPATHYLRLRTAGLVYRPPVQALKQIWHTHNRALGHIALPAGSQPNANVFNTLIFDACFQLLGALLPDTNQLYLPTQIERLALYGELPNECWVEVQKDPGRDTHTATFYTPQGHPHLIAHHIHLTPATPPSQQPTTITTPTQHPLIDTIKATTGQERHTHLAHYLQTLLSHILQRPTPISPSHSFYDLGLDSLMAVELKNAIERDFNTTLSLTTLLEDPTLANLTNQLHHQLDTPPPTPDNPLPPPTAQALLTNLDTLSEENIDALLAQLLSE